MSFISCEHCAEKDRKNPGGVWRGSIGVTYVIDGVSYQRVMHTITYPGGGVFTHDLGFDPTLPDHVAEYVAACNRADEVRREDIETAQEKADKWHRMSLDLAWKRFEEAKRGLES